MVLSVGRALAENEQVADVREFGAKGDGQVATDCSITLGSNTLTCTTNHFDSGCAGKVIAVYDAGPTQNGYRQPLSSTILAFVSATHITLADSASATANPSSRVVWGTNNDAALQATVDALSPPNGQGGNIGGVVLIPRGRYLTHGVSLLCAKIGNL